MLQSNTTSLPEVDGYFNCFSENYFRSHYTAKEQTEIKFNIRMINDSNKQ